MKTFKITDSYGKRYATFHCDDFDSEILGLKCAKIDYLAIIPYGEQTKRDLIDNLFNLFAKNKIEYVTIRINASDLATIQTLEDSDFNIVDGYLTLQRNLDNIERTLINPNIKIRQAAKKDILNLQNSIAPGFIHSRFFNDPIIPKEKAVEIFREWIKNSVLGKVADCVFVAEAQGKAVGFITLEIDQRVGHIPLIGVEQAFRGKGVSHDLTSKAFDYFNKKKLKTVRIETQITNIPATRSYENIGFRLVDSSVTLRWAKKD